MPRFSLSKNNHPYLEVRNSKIHGKGVYAKGPIAPRTQIIEYTGEKISHAESDRRELLRQKRKAKGKPSDIFMFELDEKWYIDGTKNGSIARYINHSCNANCTPRLRDNRIWYFSNRTIKKGEELSIDYGFDFDVWSENLCRCGAPQCIGFIVRKNIRWRVLAQLKREKRIKKSA
ncbi:MAG: SET domain-containing protein-lysine N-methyltransferase [Verrucomicrobiota bacterium]